MRKLRGPALLLALLLIAGCSWFGGGSPTGKPRTAPQEGAGIGAQASPPAAPSVTDPSAQAPAPSTGPGPNPTQPPAWTDADLAAVGSPAHLKPEELADWVTKAANAGKEPLKDWFQALVVHYRAARPESIQQADLDEDGTPETVLVLNGDPGSRSGAGGLFVVYRRGSGYAVDEYLNNAPDASTLMLLHTLADLTGDDRPEIIASLNGHGAHAEYSTVEILRWAPGKLEPLPGPRMSMTFMELSVDGKELILSGGTSGSVGAGPERTYTDRYRWVNGAMTLVDRRYAPSEDAYFLLHDGIVAEQFGRKEDARAAYTKAMEPGRTTLAGVFLNPNTPEAARKFSEAVRAFARFRLGGLLLSDPATAAEGRKVLGEATGLFAGLPNAMLAAGNKEAGCRVAQEWAEAAPEFLAALNSPGGYGEPTWAADELCQNALPPHR